MSFRLRPYQVEAVQWLWDHDRCALFLDMGLGKTAICLAALEDDHLPALVIAPKRPTESTWPTERGIWRPDLTVAVASGSKAKRMAALDAGADLTCISRDNLKDVVGRKYRTIIIDELSSFKSPSSQRTKLARKITADAQYVWGLTGTPASESLQDLWAQIFLLDRGERLCRTVSAFRQKWFRAEFKPYVRGPVYTDPLPGAQDEIQSRLSDLCLSMGTAGRVALPEFSKNIVPIQLPADAMEAHRDMMTHLVYDGVLAQSKAVAYNKALQITAGRMYTDEGELKWLHDAKLDRLSELIDVATSPVLVFYRYKFEVEALKQRFPQLEVMSRELVDRWNAGKVPIMAANPKSAGHGLNLQKGGHTAVWLTPTWSSEEDQQANKRLHRSGQDYPVVSHYFVATLTVDEIVMRALEGKEVQESDFLRYLER